MRRHLAVAVTVLASGCEFDVSGDVVTDVEVQWQLFQDGEPVACADVSVHNIRVDFARETGGGRFADWFACADGAGIAVALPVDDYRVDAAALDDHGAPLDEVGDIRLTLRGGELATMAALEFSFAAR
jgi:hypothetical protein